MYGLTGGRRIAGLTGGVCGGGCRPAGEEAGQSAFEAQIDASVRLDETTAMQVDQYADVVDQARNPIFRQDRDFQCDVKNMEGDRSSSGRSIEQRNYERLTSFQ